MPQDNNIFSEFRNLYSLTKTLRFELKPTEETKKLLKKTNNLGFTPVQTDKEIDRLYNEEMKPMYDKLHEKFITESLEYVEFDLKTLSELEENYLEFKKLSKNKKENKIQLDLLQRTDKGKALGVISGLQAKLRLVIAGSTKPKILGSYDKTADIWKSQNYKDIKLKGDGFDVVLLESVQEILIKENPYKEKQIREFKKSVGWTNLRGLVENRTNYYTNDGKVTEVAFRCININLIKFIENKAIFENAKTKVPSLSEFDDYFKLENFSNYLTQAGIENFNDVLGIIKSKVNLEHNQKTNKNEQIRGFNKLHKQIGCKTREQRELEESGQNLYPDFLEKVGLGFKITKNDKDYQIWEAVESLSKQLENKIKNLQKGYLDFFKNWENGDFDLAKIWFRKEALNTISGRWFGGSNWSVLGRSLSHNKVGSIGKEGEYTIPQFVSLADMKEALEKLENGVEFDLFGKIRKQAGNTSLTKYTAENLFLDRYRESFKSTLFDTFLTIWQTEIESKFKEIKDYKKIFNENKTTKFDKNIKDENGLSFHTKTVKNLIEDGYLRLLQLTKYHSLEKKGEIVNGFEPDNNFYEELNNFWGDGVDSNNIVMYHKALQSSLTEKPFETDKIKLNFERGNLFTGWSDDKDNAHTFQYGSTFIRKDGKYFVVIIKDNQAFSLKKHPEAYNVNSVDCELMGSKLLKSTTIYGSLYKGKFGTEYTPDKDILDTSVLIDRVKSILGDKVSTFGELQEIIDTEFTDLNKLASKLGEKDYYTPNFIPIDYQFVKKQEISGKIYLFEISNQNLKSKSKTPNLHTTYFNILFSDDNVQNGVIKMDANASIFYRPKSIKKEIDQIRSKNYEIMRVLLKR